MIRVGGRPRTAQKKGIELQFFFIFFENWKLFGIVFCDFQLNDIRVKIKSKSLKNLFFWIELPISVKTGKVDYPTQKPHAPWMWLQICILKICWLTFIFTEKGRVGDIQMNRSLSSYGVPPFVTASKTTSTSKYSLITLVLRVANCVTYQKKTECYKW